LEATGFVLVTAGKKKSAGRGVSRRQGYEEIVVSKI